MQVVKIMARGMQEQILTMVHGNSRARYTWAACCASAYARGCWALWRSPLPAESPKSCRDIWGQHRALCLGDSLAASNMTQLASELKCRRNEHKKGLVLALLSHSHAGTAVVRGKCGPQDSPWDLFNWRSPSPGSPFPPLGIWVGTCSNRMY